MAGDLICFVALQLSAALLFLTQIIVFAPACGENGVFSVISCAAYTAFLVLAAVTALRDPGTCLAPKTSDLTPQYGVYSVSEHTAFEARKCLSCDFWMPPLTRHCGACNRCVLFFDHHCTYLNTDIGCRNYLLFNFLLWAVAFFYSSAVVCIVWGAARITLLRPDPDVLPVASLTAAVLLGYYACVGVYFAFNMIDYHRYLRRRNLTTYACVKREMPIRSEYKNGLLHANRFLEEIMRVDEKHRWMRYLPHSWRRQVTAFFMPKLTNMARDDAIAAAWAYGIYLGELRGNMPERIIAFM